MTKCHFNICAQKPPAYVPARHPYPYSPITLSDFLRKKRLDLNLTQKQVANLLKTSIANIRNWETNRGRISVLFHPRIIEFVGYCPYDASLSLGLRLKERHENFGLSIRKLSRLLDVDPCAIASWERRKHQPPQRYVKIIEGFLKSYAPEKSLTQQPRHFTQEAIAPISPFPQYVEYDARWAPGRKIIAWRTGAGLSVRKLARLAGICFQSICRWEKGQRIPKPKYLKLILQIISAYVNSFAKEILYL